MNYDLDIFSSRYFIKSDPIMADFRLDDVYIELFNWGWWSRIYEYEWIRSICSSFFKDNKNCSIIDIATGRHHPNIFILRSTGFGRVVGTDVFDLSRFVYSKYLGKGCEYIMDDLLNPNINEKFDCVTCISLLEHLKPNDQEKATKNLIKYLKPNGFIALTFDMPGYEYKTNLGLYREILVDNGFNIKSTEVNNEDIVKTIDSKNIPDGLKKMNLSCYRMFAWR